MHRTLHRARSVSASEMSAGDAPTRAALCDLLEVTRRVMLPPVENGTFWCEDVDPRKMVEWTLSELAEVEDEIKAADEALHREASFPDACQKPAAEACSRLQDELGDLVFDVLMLGCVCERRFGSGRHAVSLSGAISDAAAKVKRRCPYVFGPLQGPAPDRAAEEVLGRPPRRRKRRRGRREATAARAADEALRRGDRARGNRRRGGVLLVAAGACALGFGMGMRFAARAVA